MAAAHAKWARMTPVQLAAAKKAARAKQPWEWTALDNEACNNCYSTQRSRFFSWQACLKSDSSHSPAGSANRST
jgi:hypothetical protein